MIPITFCHGMLYCYICWCNGVKTRRVADIYDHKVRLWSMWGILMSFCLYRYPNSLNSPPSCAHNLHLRFKHTALLLISSPALTFKYRWVYLVMCLWTRERIGCDKSRAFHSLFSSCVLWGIPLCCKVSLICVVIYWTNSHMILLLNYVLIKEETLFIPSLSCVYLLPLTVYVHGWKRKGRG